MILATLDTVCWGASPHPPPPLSSLDVFGEADLVRKTSVIFEALQRFGEHAQCASEQRSQAAVQRGGEGESHRSQPACQGSRLTAGCEDN